MYHRTETQGSLMLEKAIFLEDINSNMTSRERKFKKMFNKPSKLNSYADTSTIGELKFVVNYYLIFSNYFFSHRIIYF